MIGKQVVFIDEGYGCRPNLMKGDVLRYVGEAKDQVEVQYTRTSYTFNQNTGCHDIPKHRVAECWCYLDQVYVV